MTSILKTICDRISVDEADNFARFDAHTFILKERPSPINILPFMEEKFFFIAEVKQASPSRGMIRPNFNPEEIAASYIRANACAISVITESNFFMGRKEYLSSIKQKTALPVLRKDFIFHPFQVYESYNLGADFILLIAACLEQPLLRHLYQLAQDLGMQVLLEVHNERELESALQIGPAMLGINNRNLKTFQVDCETSFRLKRLIPPGVKVISESGIKNHTDILDLKGAGFNGVLVGESLLREEDPAEALRRLIHG